MSVGHISSFFKSRKKKMRILSATILLGGLTHFSLESSKTQKGN